MKRTLTFLCLVLLCTSTRGALISTPFGTSRQVNVDTNGLNIPGDAANEPSMCVDPTSPNRIAVGWRQFDTTNSNFRQGGYAYTTNGGLNWTSGKVEPGTFRSDPVLASDANGVFYYLGISNTTTFACDLFKSTNGGANWTRVGGALGGDKEWMAIDTTSGPGRGNIYQVWSPFGNIYNNSQLLFTRSTDKGVTWMPAINLPHQPYWGTIAIGPNGEVYNLGTAIDIEPFWLNRSSNATNAAVTPTMDVSVVVDLGGPPVVDADINPVGLLGQAWIAVDCSTNSTRGYVYALCSVTNAPGDQANVMFSRSIDGGRTWSPPLRINDDPTGFGAVHWFGTLSVAPNGRLDACWNDTRHSPNNDNSTSELYYSWSDDAGLTWAPNRPISPPFNHSLGYPQQEKMGDYIGMSSLDSGACIAYTATFNGEEDVYFVRAELPIVANILQQSGLITITWNGVPGGNYCVQTLSDLSLDWTTAGTVGCLTGTTSTPTLTFAAPPSSPAFYRVVRQP